MNDKELRVKHCESFIREAEIKVRQAKNELDHGYTRLKAEMEREYAKLKLNVESAQVELERSQNSLKNAEAELARGFEA